MEKIFKQISLISGDTQAKIAPERGALVTFLSINDTKILYLDTQTFDDLTKNVRGGIPILFPNAGPVRGEPYNLPQHGFVRNMSWNIVGQKENSITLQLQSNKETKLNFPFDFEMLLKVKAEKNKLIHCLTVKNVGNKPMPTAYGTHPYFEIPQNDKQRLRTNIAGFNPHDTNWMKQFDNSFGNPGLIVIQMPGKEIRLKSDPNIFKFIRIWHQVGKNFICIEPWTRDCFALEDPNQSLWLKPNESVNLSIVLYAKIIKYST